MELGPIFRALLHRRSRFWLITVEIALTLAIVANCVHMIVDMRQTMSRPTGIDEAHVLAVTTLPFGEAFRDETFIDDLRRRDLAALAAEAGVRAASATQAFPLSGGGSSTGRRAVDAPEDAATSTPYFLVMGDPLQALGVELAAGRDFVPSDWDHVGADAPEEDTTPRNVIVTQTMADVLFPDGGALGSVITSRRGERTDRIVGIVRHMHNSWPTSDIAERAMFLPAASGGRERMRYLVRAEPGAAETLYGRLEELLLTVESERIVQVESMAEVKAGTYGDQVALVRLLGGVIALLVLVTGLGVVGLTTFSVAERRRQIGTRRALGAPRAAILRYFLIENWIVTSIGLALGVGLAYALNMGLGRVADAPPMPWYLVATGMLLLWVLGQVAALLPAVRSTRVPPVVATRTV